MKWPARAVAAVFLLLLLLVFASHAGARPPFIGPQPACLDTDGDGFADCAVGGCDPAGLTCGDCADGDPEVHPGAADTCDHRDNDCNGVIDQNDPIVSDSRVFVRPGDPAGTAFGSAVASIGDVTGDGVGDIAVGDAHRAYVQVGSLTVLSGSDGAEVCRTETGQRGVSVTAVGDVTGDGIPDFAAGIPEAHVEGPVQGGYSGGIEVFSGSDCALICRGLDYVPIFDAYSGYVRSGYGQLGFSVARVADLDGDGVSDILAGDPAGLESSFGLSNPVPGRAALFSGKDCRFLARFIGTASGQRFGHAVAGAPDMDGDGVADMAIGAPGGTGGIHIISGAAFSRIRILPPGIAAAGVGSAIVALGDLDGDLVPDFAAGAPLADSPGASDAGAVLLLSGATGGLLRTCTHPNRVAGDNLGRGLASPGDLDHDGTPDLAAVAPMRDTFRGVNAGQIVYFSGDDCAVLAYAEDEAGEPNASLGLADWGQGPVGALAAAGDIDGDGIGEIIVGAPRADAGGVTDRGRVLIVGLQTDCDGDGATPFGGDCADDDPLRGPAMPDFCDGIDNDCDGIADDSADGDPVGVCSDCDDSDPAIYPGAPELCDGRDNDCDGQKDEGTDNDGDGVTTPCDCRDDDGAIHPGAAERCNQVDDDCDGVVDNGPDADADGSQAPCDCNDGNPLVRPGAREMCNGLDDDCDGRADDEVAPYATAETLLDPAAAAHDEFGRGLAGLGDIDGDGVGDFAIGAGLDDTPGKVDAGSVLLYSGSTRTPLCRISSPGSTLFGYPDAVVGPGDLTGDGIPDIAVGDPTFRVAGVNATGAVAIVSGATCTIVRRCIDPDPPYNLDLGWSLATIPDITGDGVSDLLAGTTAEQALVFSGADCAFRYRLSAATPGDAGFGRTLAAIGDIDGDGFADLAIGAYLAGNVSFRSGRVDLFSGRDGTPLGSLVEPTTRELGYVLEGVDDVDGDGLPDVVASAWQGKPTLFSSATKQPIRSCDSLFGVCAYDTIADMNGDGVRELVAGRCAAAPTPNLGFAGVVTIFSPTDCTVLATLSDPAAAASALLGEDVAVVGDLDGDGAPEILAGAPRRDTAAGEDAGSAVMFGREAACSPNQTPIAHAVVQDASVECDRPGGGLIPLDGSGSSDADSTPGTSDDIASYEWFEDYGAATERLLGVGPLLSVTLPLGEHAVTLRVTDRAGATDIDAASVTVVDTLPPSLSVLASPATLWPPNHRMVPVSVTWAALDACDNAALRVELVSVTSSEPDDQAGMDDGSTTQDIQDADLGTADISLLLRAERSAQGPGRIYELLYRAVDGVGNVTSARAVVSVPHDQGHGPDPLLLRLEPVGHTTAQWIDWPAIAGAIGYDVIRGTSNQVRLVNGVIDLGAVTVLARGTPQTSLTEGANAPVPEVGQAFFYLVQERTEFGAAGWGSEPVPWPRVPGSCEGGCPPATGVPSGGIGGADPTPRR